MTKSRSSTVTPAGGGYELRYLARKFGLTTAQAVAVKRRGGGDKARENQIAREMSRG